MAVFAIDMRTAGFVTSLLRNRKIFEAVFVPVCALFVVTIAELKTVVEGPIASDPDIKPPPA